MPYFFPWRLFLRNKQFLGYNPTIFCRIPCIQCISHLCTLHFCPGSGYTDINRYQIQRGNYENKEKPLTIINRLDYGKKYCHHSPSIEESLLQDAVMRAIMQTAKQNIEVLKTLKIHIGMGLTDEVTEDKTLDIQIRIAEIAAEFQKMLKAVSADNADGIDEERITELMNEKQRLTVQLEQYASVRQKRESSKSRLDEIFTILDGLQNHPMKYNDTLVRQIIECVVVESKEKIKVVFIGGTEIEMTL